MNAEIRIHMIIVICLTMSCNYLFKKEEEPPVNKKSEDASDSEKTDSDDKSMPERSGEVGNQELSGSIASGLLNDESLKSMLQKWLDAQNEGDFQAYEPLYATLFDGIKRAGKRTFQFNREGWLKDRKKMFAKPMSVKAQDVLVSVVGSVGRIDFVQTWTSGSYSDKGPKVLMVTIEDKELKIFREEMLESLLARKKGEEKTPDWLDRFYLVMNNSYVVLSQLDKKVSAKGAVYKGNYIASWPIDKKMIHKLSGEHETRRLLVGTKDGKYIKKKLSQLVGLAKNIYHSGVNSNWEEDGATDEKKGHDIVEWSRWYNNIYAAAVLEPQIKGAIWAMEDMGTPPEIFKSVEISKEDKETVLAALLESKKSKQIQQWFIKDGYKGKWYEYKSYKDVRTFIDGNKNKYVFAQVRAGDGCGDFFGYISSYFNMTTGDVVDLGAPEDFFKDVYVDDYAPYVALDIDGDGFPEFVGKGKIMYKSGVNWHVHELKIPYGDCPC